MEDIIWRSGVFDAEKLIARLESRLHPTQMTWGDLIEALRILPADVLARPAAFELPWVYPTHFNSYRGYYDQLALGAAHVGNLPLTMGKQTTGGEILERARSTVGVTHTGWKGGDYIMGNRTPVWVDNAGECNSVMLVGVRSSVQGAVLLTRREGLE